MAPNGEAELCPSCGEPRAEDVRYCEECGHDYGGQAAEVAEERSRLSGPLLWVFMLFWVVLAIAGLWFLFTALWAA
ncbi:MAG: zinc-ribbon domain-containing protein [Chloroflexota bacterium]